MNADRVERRHDDDDLTLGRVGLHLPRPGPKSLTALTWWILAMYALFFAQGFVPSAESEQAYSELMQEAVFSQARRIPKLLGVRPIMRDISCYFSPGS